MFKVNSEDTRMTADSTVFIVELEHATAGCGDRKDSV